MEREAGHVGNRGLGFAAKHPMGKHGSPSITRWWDSITMLVNSGRSCLDITQNPPSNQILLLHSLREYYQRTPLVLAPFTSQLCKNNSVKVKMNTIS